MSGVTFQTYWAWFDSNCNAEGEKISLNVDIFGTILTTAFKTNPFLLNVGRMKTALGLGCLKPPPKRFSNLGLRQLNLGSWLCTSKDFTVKEHFPNVEKLQTQYFNMKIKENSFKNFVCNELIEECNLNVSSFYLQGFEKKFVITVKLQILKKHGVINADLNEISLANGFLSYLEPFPFDSKLLTSTDSASSSGSMTIKQIRDSIEKQYLAWKFKADLKQIENILARLHPCLFTYRSLRNLRRNTSILDMIPSAWNESLSKKIYLLNQHPFSPSLVLKFQNSLSHLNWDLFSSRGHKTLQSSFDHIYFMIQVLKNKGFTNKQIQEGIPYFHLNFDTFLNRMNVMLSHPALIQHRKHEQFLCLLEYQTVHVMNLESLNFAPLENLRTAIDMIHSNMSIRNRAQRININSIKFHVSNYFVIGKDQLNLIKRHPKYCVITEEQLGSTLRFLKESGFSSSEVLESIIIILYPRQVISKALKKITEEAEVLKKVGIFNGSVPESTDFFNPGTKLKEKTLQLCLYYIEKQFNFSWDGVLNLSAKDSGGKKKDSSR